VRSHFCEIVYASFSWRSGSFRLEPLPPTFRPRVAIEQSGASLLLEGLRRRYRAEELVELLGGSAAAPRSRLAASAPPPDGLLPGEAELIALADGTRPVEQVVALSRLDRAQALAVLYGLTLLGHLELPGAGALPRVGTESQARAVDRSRLEERIRQSQEADYFTLLGLGPEASPYEIRLAHERRRAEIAPERVAALGALDLEDRLRQARYALDEALEILSDDELRAAYRRARFTSRSPSSS
jgi:hypothetical protein